VTDQELRERIVVDPKVMVGKPCIRGTRIPVRMIVNVLAHGVTFDEIFEEYPRLTRDDILACLLYAADVLERTPPTDDFRGNALVVIAEVTNRGSSDG
jgi:uncharacterized protein (DUF433 family)